MSLGHNITYCNLAEDNNWQVNMDNCKAFVDISVQGTQFTLKKSFVLSNDWVLNQVITGLIQWEKVNETVYYIDCDAKSFRCIINFFRNPTDISIIATLDTIDIMLLQRAKEYLSINDKRLDSEINNNKIKMKENENETLHKMNEHRIMGADNDIQIKINEHKIKEMEQEMQIIKLKEEINKLKVKENKQCNILGEDVIEDLVNQFNQKYRLDIGSNEFKEDPAEEKTEHFKSCVNRGSIFDSAYSSDFPDVL